MTISANPSLAADVLADTLEDALTDDDPEDALADDDPDPSPEDSTG